MIKNIPTGTPYVFAIFTSVFIIGFLPHSTVGLPA
nr:MAG TPA: Photosystem II protein D1 [Bacteriophage sp.]